MTDRNSQTQPRMITAKQRRAEAVKLRTIGLTFEQIGERLGITKQAAHKTVTRALQDMSGKLSETTSDLITLEKERLDRMQFAVWPGVLNGNLGAIDKALHIMERRAKLLGLDQKPDDKPTTVRIEIVRDNELK